MTDWRGQIFSYARPPLGSEGRRHATQRWVLRQPHDIISFRDFFINVYFNCQKCSFAKKYDDI